MRSSTLYMLCCKLHMQLLLACAHSAAAEPTGTLLSKMLQVNETAGGGFSISINFCSTLCTSIFQVPCASTVQITAPSLTAWPTRLCIMLPESASGATNGIEQPTSHDRHAPAAAAVGLVMTAAASCPPAGVLHPGAPLLVQILRAAGLHCRRAAAGWAPTHLIEQCV